MWARAVSRNLARDLRVVLEPPLEHRAGLLCEDRVVRVRLRLGVLGQGVDGHFCRCGIGLEAFQLICGGTSRNRKGSLATRRIADDSGQPGVKIEAVLNGGEQVIFRSRQHKIEFSVPGLGRVQVDMVP